MPGEQEGLPPLHGNGLKEAQSELVAFIKCDLHIDLFLSSLQAWAVKGI